MRIFLTLFILTLTLLSSLAEEPLTLQRAIDLAIAQNPGFEMSRQNINAADGRRIDSSKWENPKLILMAGEAPYRGGVGRGQMQAGLKQEIPFPGKKRLDREIGKASVVLSNHNLLSAKVLLIRDVKLNFYEVLANKRRYALAGEILRLTQNSSQSVTKRLDAGRASVQELLRAEIETERAAIELEGARQMSVTARQELAALIGNVALVDANIGGDLNDFINRSLIKQVKQRSVISEHPQIAAARASIDRADLSLKRARLEKMPNLTTRFLAGRDGSSNENIFGLFFSLPLPLINNRKGLVQEAGANLKIAQSELKEVELALTTQLRSSYQRYVAAARQVEAYRDRILPKADEAVSLVNKGFAEGRFTLTDLLDTQRTTTAAWLMYQDKLFELLSSQADIEALMDDAGESNLTESKD